MSAPKPTCTRCNGPLPKYWHRQTCVACEYVQKPEPPSTPKPEPVAWMVGAYAYTALEFEADPTVQARIKDGAVVAPLYGPEALAEARQHVEALLAELLDARTGEFGFVSMPSAGEIAAREWLAKQGGDRG